MAPPPIFVDQIPMQLATVNWIQGLFPTLMATLRGFCRKLDLREPSSLLEASRNGPAWGGRACVSLPGCVALTG